ncbi:MAG: Asp-tRNA(Asn)/Glu-tRNA(Gln) amidotransferase subunit GatA [Myxococcota bacterium]
MADTHITWASIEETQRQLSAGTLTSVALTEMCLARIKAHPELGAFLALDEKGALAAAVASDERRKAGRTLGPLDGIPVAHKDLLCTEGVPTTAASRILEGYLPPYDATVVRRWKDAGTVLLGKLNMDEFGMGSSTENSAYGPARNPWDLTRTPGGSSGGSAAAVAAGLCFGATGTDTGGSIRQPAALTSLVGIKPTYGRVSRFGCIAYASSLDQVGVFARTVRDAAYLLHALAGHDPKDSTSLNAPVVDYAAALGGDLKGMRLGLPREYMTLPGMEPEVQRSVEEACRQMEKLGATLVDISLPHTRYALPTYYVVAPAEASSNLARYDGIRYGPRKGAQNATLREMYEETRGQLFGLEVKRRIMLGAYVLSAGYYDAYYGQAQKVRSLIKRDFDEAFAKIDVVICPTSPTVAFKLGEKVNDPVAMYLSDVFTLSCNLAGLPGMSLPCGFSSGEKPLPIGLQLMGRPLEEHTLFKVAHAYEQATEWHRRHPSLVGGAA